MRFKSYINFVFHVIGKLSILFMRFTFSEKSWENFDLFQFSLWDSNYSGVAYINGKRYSFNSLYEIPKCFMIWWRWENVLSILFMRFYKIPRTGAVWRIQLSILFMRFSSQKILITAEGNSFNSLYEILHFDEEEV